MKKGVKSDGRKRRDRLDREGLQPHNWLHQDKFWMQELLRGKTGKADEGYGYGKVQEQVQSYASPDRTTTAIPLEDPVSHIRKFDVRPVPLGCSCKLHQESVQGYERDASSQLSGFDKACSAFRKVISSIEDSYKRLDRGVGGRCGQLVQSEASAKGKSRRKVSVHRTPDRPSAGKAKLKGNTLGNSRRRKPSRLQAYGKRMGPSHQKGVQKTEGALLPETVRRLSKQTPRGDGNSGRKKIQANAKVSSQKLGKGVRIKSFDMSKLEVK